MGRSVMNGVVLVCLDRFRGCLTATEAGVAVATGVSGAGGRAVAMPVADGGEGTGGRPGAGRVPRGARWTWPAPPDDRCAPRSPCAAPAR